MAFSAAEMCDDLPKMNNTKSTQLIKYDGKEYFVDQIEVAKYNKKLRFRTFTHSYIWLIIPLCLIVFTLSFQEYFDSKADLTPYSVHVNSYYRSDGTYVSDYYRRPPGGVLHDEPLKSTMFWTFISMILSVITPLLSVFIFISNVSNRIQKNLTLLEAEVYERNKKIVIKSALMKANINFEHIRNFPKNLKFGSSHRCKFCRSYITENELCIVFKAKIYFHYICTSCSFNRTLYGRNQKSIDYQVELDHIKKIDLEFNRFKEALIDSIVGNVSFTLRDTRILFRELLTTTGNISLNDD